MNIADAKIETQEMFCEMRYYNGPLFLVIPRSLKYFLSKISNFSNLFRVLSFKTNWILNNICSSEGVGEITQLSECKDLSRKYC